MRKAALLYNPSSGGSKKRQRELEWAVGILRGTGIEAVLVPTDSPEHASEEVHRSIAEDCDTIFACGGDGTIHNIIQELAKTPIALGILPMGTANALAHDLGLPISIAGAAKAALTARTRRIALGSVRYIDLQGNPGTRYFVIAAGIGVDAHLFYKLHSRDKQRIGMAAYYAKAWNLWFTYRMPRFLAEYLETSGTEPIRAEVTELMSVRIRNFGGVVHELAPGASLDRDDMRVVACRTASRLAYLAYVTRGLLHQRWNVRGIDLAFSSHVSCRYRESDESNCDRRKIYVEADGELLGTLPVEITVIDDALTLLAPAP